MAAAAASPNEILVWDTSSGRRLLSIPTPVRAFAGAAIAQAPDDTLIAAGGNRVQIHPMNTPVRP